MTHTIVMIMVGTGAVMLTVAAGLTVVRISRGPSSLDRVVAADVLVAVVIGALALEAILNHHATTLPVMLVLSLLGFAGAVSIARFVADRDKASRWNVPGDEPPSAADDRAGGRRPTAGRGTDVRPGPGERS